MRRRPSWRSLLTYERAGRVEVELFGALAWAKGEQIDHTIGEAAVFARSLLKPFQIGAIVDTLEGLPEEQLAIAVASHAGTPDHLEVVRALLGPRELALAPASALGGRPGGPMSPLHHPCSGKHAAIALAAERRAWSSSFLSQRHPFHAELERALEGWLGRRDFTFATDGCGLPTPELTLGELARLFAALAVDETLAPVRGAMVAHPTLVGGPGRLDSTLLELGGGRVFAKEGADGLLGVGVAGPSWPRGLGLALKLAHGWDRVALHRLAAHLLAPELVPLPAPEAPAGQRVRFAPGLRRGG